jgi:hypothetical protein
LPADYPSQSNENRAEDRFVFYAPGRQLRYALLEKTESLEGSVRLVVPERRLPKIVEP